MCCRDNPPPQISRHFCTSVQSVHCTLAQYRETENNFSSSTLSLTSGQAGEQHESHPGQGGGGGGQDVTQAVGGPDGQAAEVPGGPGDEAVVEAGEQHEAQPGQGGGGGGQDVFQDVGGVVHIFTSDQTLGKA